MKNLFVSKSSLAATSLFFSLVLCGCKASSDNSNVDVFNDPVPGEPYLEQHLIIHDSFERDSVGGDPQTQELFGWRGFIWDHGQAVVGNIGRSVSAVIMGKDLMGEASDGEKALYFYGRKGHSVHNIYLITHSFDLSEWNEVIMEFDYLTFSLDDPKDLSDGVEEYLRIDVCVDDPHECGAGKNISHGRLKHGGWETVFEDDPLMANPLLDGHNHVREDWATGRVHLDITQFHKRDTFTFRVSTRMRDGFENNKLENRLEDGVALDNIRVLATRIVDPEDDGSGDSDGGGDGGDLPDDGDDPGYIIPVIDD